MTLTVQFCYLEYCARSPAKHIRAWAPRASYMRVKTLLAARHTTQYNIQQLPKHSLPENQTNVPLPVWMSSLLSSRGRRDPGAWAPRQQRGCFVLSSWGTSASCLKMTEKYLRKIFFFFCKSTYYPIQKPTYKSAMKLRMIKLGIHNLYSFLPVYLTASPLSVLKVNG